MNRTEQMIQISRMFVMGGMPFVQRWKQSRKFMQQKPVDEIFGNRVKKAHPQSAQ